MKTLKPQTKISKPSLTIFVLLFALVGGLTLLLSLALPNPNLKGDLNNDGKVDGADISVLATYWHTNNANADITGDGTVDIADLAQIILNFGKSIAAVSPDNTVVNGTNGKITDSNGHSWTITSGGQVAVDGVVDTTTANVTRLAYETGKVWQENTSNLWWYKILPTDSWAPSAGTSVSPIPGQQQTSGGYLRGVNLSTFQSMSSTPTNFEMIDSLASLQYLKSHGVDLVRIPLPWGRLQPTLGGPLDNVFTPKLQTLVSRCASAGIKVVLDQHSNGGWSPSGGSRYSVGEYTAAFGSNPGGGKTPISSAQFVSFWTQMDNLFRNNSTVIAYDLVNEPFANGPAGDVISKATFQSYQQAAVTALRNQGSQKEIWIEGMNSSQPQGWAANNGAPWITDPANNIVYSMHTYPTSDTNGNSEYNASDPYTANYLSRIDEFEAWRKQYGVKASVGETGWPSQQKGAPNTWQQYNSLGDAWFKKADQYGYTVTMWQANAAQEEGFDLYTPTSFPNPYVTPTPILSVARTNATILQAHPSKAVLDRPLVTLTFDDGTVDQYNNALPLLQQNGQHATFYIITSAVGTSGHMTTSQIQTLNSDGMEIGNHTYDHADLTTLTTSQITSEMSDAETYLTNLLGKSVPSFAYPYGTNNATTVSIGKQYFKSQRIIGNALNTKSTVDMSQIKSEPVLTTTSNATVQGWIDQAVANNQWLVLLYHQTADTGDATYRVTIANLTAQLAYLHSKGVAVLTMDQAVNEINALNGK